MKAQILARADKGHGTSSLKVQCSCGGVSYFAIWSWAGNGCIRCWHCKRRIDYRTLEVLEDQTKEEEENGES